MHDKPKIPPAAPLIGAVVLLVLAAALIFRQASKPAETIGDFSKIPPKGAGRVDRGG